MVTELHEKNRDASWIIWLGLPAASLAFRLLIPLVGKDRCTQLMRSEFGIVENATVLFLLVAIVASVIVFRRRAELPKGVGWVMLFLGIAFLYFAGEEISWGQHYFGWGTPEVIEQINEQDETNVHNIGGFLGYLLNGLPRQLLNIGMFAAVVLPILLPALKRRSDRLRAGAADKQDERLGQFVKLTTSRRSFWYWLIPNYRIVPIALMAILLRLPDKIVKFFPSPPADDSYFSLALVRASGEFKEYCFALAIMIFVLSVAVRVGPKESAHSLSP